MIIRIIRHAPNGPYGAALGICKHAQNLGQGRIDVYRIRCVAKVGEHDYAVTTTLLIIIVGGAVLLLETDRRLIAKSVPRLTLVPMLAVWLITVNPQILTVVATVRLGGAPNYRHVAMIKNGGQLLDMALPMSLVMPGFTGCWWMPEAAFPVPRIWRRGAIPGKHTPGQSDPPVDVDMQQ